MMSVYPQFRTECRNKTNWEAAILSWRSAIGDLTDAELRAACFWCKNTDEPFVPTVGRFRHKAKGLPDTEIAFLEALEGNPDNYAVSAARAKVGSYAWSHDSESNLKAKFFRAYAKICEDILAGNYGKNKKNDTVAEINHSKQIEKSRNGAPTVIIPTPGTEAYDDYLDEKFPIIADQGMDRLAASAARRENATRLHNVMFTLNEKRRQK